VARARKQPRKAGWTNRRIQVVVGALLAAFAVFGLAIPMTAIQFENHDSFCASCHTEGEVTFFKRATSSAAADLASFHAQRGATRCIDCHSAPGIIGRYITLTYGASDLISYFRGNYAQPAVQDTPLGDGNCTKCHGDIYNSQDFNNHFHAFLPKWQSLDPANAARCIDCHLSHDTINDAGAVFLDQTATQQVCQKCHAFAGQG
jgi:nitrate/TMAO reductase-like tetraheme cytochrome c subunit